MAVYPHRWTVPRDTWGHLFEQAEREIGILVYSGYFIAEDVGMRRLLATKAESGVRARILLGDPDSPFVTERGQSGDIDDMMFAKARSAIAMFRSLRAVENAEIRLYGTILHNSIYRSDEQLLVNTHIYGVMANNAPVFQRQTVLFHRLTWSLSTTQVRS
jgi:hypothetical protein